MDEEVAPIDGDEGAHAEVVQPEAQPLVQVLARLGRLRVLHPAETTLRFPNSEVQDLNSVGVALGTLLSWASYHGISSVD